VAHHTKNMNVGYRHAWGSLARYNSGRGLNHVGCSLKAATVRAATHP